MTIDISAKQKQIDFLEIFCIVCLAYTVITMLAIFLEEDLFRILSPFLAPFLLLFIALGYLVLVAASILYVPFQIRNLAWRARIPITINLITFLVVYNFYDSLEKLRVDIGFQVNEQRLNKAANWVIQSIRNGDLDLNERSDTIVLPKEDGDIVCMRRIKTNWYDCY